AFADIRRLAPAQYLVFSDDGVRVKNYWALSTNCAVQYRAAGDYVEHFKHLLSAAVSDRLRTDRIAVEMSGGLDSTSVTAVALEQLKAKSSSFELSAYTMVFDHLIPDQERYFAGLT